MFKKSLIVILASLLLLSGCNSNTEQTENKDTVKDTDKVEFVDGTEDDEEAAPEEGYELGGYLSENGYWYIDFENPTQDSLTELAVTLSNGTEDTSYIRRPIINVNNSGANQVTKSVRDYINEKYGDYFKDPDDRIVKVDYETSYTNDILTVIISEKVITPEKTTEYYSCFHYDDMAGVELNMMEYSNTNGAQFSTVYDAVIDSDWAKEYEETVGNLPYEDAITGMVCHGDLQFDVYCLNPDGENVTKLELQVEDVPLTLPDGYDQYSMEIEYE